MTAIARKLETIREKASLKSIDIAQMMDRTAETVSRWNKGRAYPHGRNETFLMELAYIVECLSDFYTPAEAREFFLSPQRLLDGEKPAELLQRGEIKRVMNLVKQIRDSVYM